MRKRSRRKRPVKVFSGPPTSDLRALDAALSGSVQVRAYRGGCLIYAVRPEDDVLAPETEKWVSILSENPVATVSDSREIADLRAALQVAHLDDFVCMCPGDLALEFLDERRQPVEVVRFDFPDTVDWRGWGGKASLADPARILAWLKRCGVALDR